MKFIFSCFFLSYITFNFAFANPFIEDFEDSELLLCGKKNPIIKNIKVSGNNEVDEETIAGYISEFLCLETINYIELDKIIKKLFATQFFSDVKVKFSDGILYIKVQENKLVSDILFEGNKSISSKDLNEQIKIKPKTIISANKINSAIKNIRSLYQKSGRFNISINPYLITRANGTHALVFKINEGKKALIGKIFFNGNEEFSSDELKSALFSQESNAFTIFSKRVIYDADISSYNEDLLRKFYANKGYIDFKVLSVIAELNEPRTSIDISFNLEEGKKYKIDHIEIENNSKDKSIEIDISNLKTKVGHSFCVSDVAIDVNSISEQLSKKGFSFPNVSYKYTRIKDKNLLGVIFVISEASYAYINKIDILGNSRTKEEVIRREIELSEGDPFNAMLLRRSYAKLGNLNFFKKVELKTENINAESNSIDLLIDVEENKTGEVYTSLGWSTQDGITGSLAINERNLSGTGNGISLSFEKSQRASSGKFGFYFPYFLEKNFSSGVELFANKRFKDSYISYDSLSRGFMFFESFRLTDKFSLSFNQILSISEICNVDDNSSEQIKSQEESYMLNQLGYKASYANLDSNITPRKGVSVSFKQDLAGLIFGDAEFIRTEASMSYYQPFFDNYVDSWTSKLKIHCGSILPYNDSKIRLNERFYLGGNSFRGFDYRGIGARDIETQNSLGGNFYSKVSAEIDFPLTSKGLMFANSFALKGSFFIDIGNLFGIDNKSDFVLDSPELRVSAGMSVSWVIPGLNTPMRFDFGIPLRKTSYDISKVGNIVMGSF